MKKFCVAAGLLFMCNILFAGLSVDPAVVNIVSDAGGSYEGKYTVKNTYNYPIRISISVEDWNTYSGNGNIYVNEWLAFEKDKYLIASNESVEVPYTIKTKQNMQGSVSGRVYFSVDQEEGQMISIAISVPIYIVIKDTEKIDFNIDSLDLTASETGISYKLSLKNKGNVHVRPSGNIQIYAKKKLIKTVVIPETVPAYAEQSRDFVDRLVGKGELKKGKYVAVFKVRALNKEVIKEIKFKVSKLGEIVTQ